MLMVVVFSTLFHLDTTHEHTYTRKYPHKQTHTHKVTRNTVVVVDVVSWGREKKPVTEIDGVVFESIFDFTHWKQTKNTAKMSQLFFGWCEYFSDPGWRFFVHFFYTILTRKSTQPGSRVPCAAVLRFGEGHKPTANIACDINEAKNREKT